MGQARELVDQWFTLFEAGRLDELTELMHADATIALPGGVRFRGPAEFRPLLQVYHDRFSNLQHEFVDVIECGDKIVVELRITGTHAGVVHTPHGRREPTGTTVVWEMVDVITLRDGKAVNWHVYYDQLALLTQLDLLPAPGAP